MFEPFLRHINFQTLRRVASFYLLRVRGFRLRTAALCKKMKW